MPNISVTNNSSSLLALPGGFYTSPVLPGATVTFSVDNTEDFTGLTAVVALAAAGTIWISTDSSAAEERPLPCYTTAELAGTVPATLFPSGTVVYDETRMSPVASVTDIWRDHTTVVASDTAGLAALIAGGNVPLNAIAFNTDTATLVRNNGTAFVSCNLSTAISVQAATPVAGVLGDLTYSTNTQALMVCTNPAGPVWDTVFVAPVNAAPATPPPSAATVTGGVYYNTDTSRLSFRVGSNWVDLPVTHFATTAAMEAIRVVAPVNTAGQHGWDSDLNRFSVYPGGALAAWINETTVGMYAPATHNLSVGVTIFDPTGFVGTMATYGALRVCTDIAVPTWVPSTVVLPVVDLVGDLPVPADVPIGYMALVRAGQGPPVIPGGTLYWVKDVGAGVHGWANNM